MRVRRCTFCRVLIWSPTGYWFLATPFFGAPETKGSSGCHFFVSVHAKIKWASNRLTGPLNIRVCAQFTRFGGLFRPPEGVSFMSTGQIGGVQAPISCHLAGDPHFGLYLRGLGRFTRFGGRFPNVVNSLNLWRRAGNAV